MRFSGLLSVVALGCVFSQDVCAGLPKLGDESAYQVIPITQSEYLSDSTGNVYKSYEKQSDSSLVEKYYKYEQRTDKVYNEKITKEESVSGTGVPYNVPAGVGLKNEGVLDKIDGKLYQDNAFNYNFSGEEVDVYVKGGALYNAGTIGKKDVNGEFIGDSVRADFIGNKVTTQTETVGLLRVQGAALANLGEIGNIKGDFINNKAEGKFAWGGALYNQKRASIDNVTGDFLGNSVVGESSGGGALVNEGNIKGLNGNFVANKVKTNLYSAGGAIHNNDRGKIEAIHANFIDNHAEGTQQAFGGAIDNLEGELGNIKGDFIGNKVVSAYNSNINLSSGGAISNQNGNIGFIEGDFLGNEVKAVNYSVGGAISNSDGIIKGVQGDFIKNSVLSQVGSANGGAIYNDGGEIEEVSGNFIDNSVSGKNVAEGGAIYSMNQASATGKISLTNANFIDNKAISADGEAKGGAIYADKIKISANAGNSVFKGNTANGKNDGIYIDGTQSGGLLELETKNNGKIILEDVVNGETYNIAVSGQGEVFVNNRIENATDFEMKNGANLHLGLNGNINVINYNANNSQLQLDLKADKMQNKIDNGMITVSGDVSGTTNVIVNSLNQDKLNNTDDAVTVFLKAENDDQNTYSSFNVNRVIGSPYMWDAVRNRGGETSGSTWYLEATENVYTPEIPAYVGMQSAAIEQVRGVNQKLLPV